jgi:hypothetical protein
MSTKSTIPTITASTPGAPPAWALLQRRLIDIMNEAAPLVAEKYTERGSAPYYADDMDDLYEIFFSWGLFYSIGGSERVFDLALDKWNAITRWGDSDIVSRKKHGTWARGNSVETFKQQITKEYFNLSLPHGAEWHHMGEANMSFYEMGLADPTISENVRRARRFAGFMIGEDPDAPNYDPVHKIIRSPIHSSVGPYHHADAHEAAWWLQGGELPNARKYGLRTTLHPAIEDLELNWYEDPKRADEVVKLFDDMVLNGDIANNLSATALVTNAFLYTGDEKYRKWVLDYVEAWMDRTKANGGITPDNVGPTGKPGEQRGGQWWGGLYGWSTRGWNNIAHSITIGVQNALLLSGDYGYLDLLRSQINVLLDQAKTREDGQLVVPLKHGKDGWSDHGPIRLKELAHLYHLSMSEGDRDLLLRAHAGEVARDWTDAKPAHEKNDGTFEGGRFLYYEGENPGWPEKTLEWEYEWAANALDTIRGETRDPEQLIVDNVSPPHAVVTKGLTQVALGAPQSVYNGGLNQGVLRYFDDEEQRPGLPSDVAALVDELKADKVGLHLVNLDRNKPKTVIVQAGMYGQHKFTSASFGDGEMVQVNGKHVKVTLAPSASAHIGLGLQRYSNTPSYAFPWHGDTIPVPFQ